LLDKYHDRLSFSSDLNRPLMESSSRWLHFLYTKKSREFPSDSMECALVRPRLASA
jgi:hypothetical protein